MLDRTQAPEVRPIGDLALPKPSVEVLDNGITLHCLDGGTQDVNRIVLSWNGGMAEASVKSVATLANSLLREGAGSLTGAQISEALDFQGANFQSEVSDHFSYIGVSTVNSLARDVLPLLESMIVEPTYPEHALAIYRDQRIKALLLNQQKVQYLCHQALAPLITGADHPLAYDDTVEEIAAITRADLEAYHKRVYTAAGCHAYLSGRISDAYYGEVKAMLGRLPASVPADPIAVMPYHAQAPQLVRVEKADAMQDAVEMALPAPPRSHPDYIPLRFAVMALGGYFGSRLMKNIREDKGYTYGIGSYLLGAYDGSYTLISAQTDPAYVNLLIDEVKAELSGLATVPVVGDEMQRLRQHIASTLMDTLDSPFSIMDYYRTMLVANLPEGYFERQVELVKTLTPELIMDMGRRYLDPSQLRIAIAGR